MWKVYASIPNHTYPETIHIKNYFAPDSSLVDSISFNVGDTIEIYTSGLDTIYITYAEAIPDSLLEDAWAIPNPNQEMIITFSDNNAPVNQGVIGVALTDFFEPLKAQLPNNVNYVVEPTPWQALIDLAPKTIRAFSGASGKFMHPLGSLYNATDNLYYGGYGYNWREVVPYYDAMNDVILTDAPNDGFGNYKWEGIGSIQEQIDDDCEECGTWMPASEVSRFMEFYRKCTSQPTFDADLITNPNLQPLYINQLIALINMIELAHTGYDVEVIYNVNIESMSASEMIDVIDHFFENGINLIGVELGNEVYLKNGQSMMGFTDFTHYYDYIQGENYLLYEGLPEDILLTDVLPDEMEDDHDFINAIKANNDYSSIKIGLPARNTPKCGGDYDFPLAAPGEDDEAPMTFMTPIITDPVVVDPCDCGYPDWNANMVSAFDDVTTITTYQRYKFDAIIFHPYYGTSNADGECELNTNWQNIMLALHEDFDADHLSDLPIDPFTFSTTPFDYITNTYPFSSSPDIRIKDAFYHISGIHYPDVDDPLIPGNFKEFTRDRIDNSFEEHAAQMLFTHDDDGPETKEVWLTEYNLDAEVILPHDDPADIYYEVNTARFSPFAASVTNTFSNAALLQNWFLWNLKANYDPDYKSGFLTRATVQNFLGGSPIMLMNPADGLDQYLIGENSVECPSEPEMISPYFLRKTNYFAVQLWHTISELDLDYLKTVTSMASLNNNLAPTTFIDPINKELYIFYTNVTNADQKFALDPGNLNDDYGGDDYEIFFDIEAMESLILDADQLYSTSGSSPIHSINTFYEDCSEDESESENRYEIKGLTEDLAISVSCPSVISGAIPNVVCFKVPAVSLGYVKVPFHEELIPRLGDLANNFTIFPNPASNYFYINYSNGKTYNNLEVVIYNIFGNIVSTQYVTQTKSINITELPIGVYFLEIKNNGFIEGKEKIVKMK